MTQPNTTQHGSLLVASEEDGKALALGLLTCASWSGTVRSKLFEYAKPCIKPGSHAERVVLDYIENAPYELYRDIQNHYIIPTAGMGPERWLWMLAFLGGSNENLNEVRIFAPDGGELQVISLSKDAVRNPQAQLVAHAPLFSIWARKFMQLHEWKPELLRVGGTRTDQRIPAQSLPYLRLAVSKPEVADQTTSKG